MFAMHSGTDPSEGPLVGWRLTMREPRILPSESLNRNS